MPQTDLVRALVSLQRAEGWTDARMARELGVSQAMWTLVKGGRRNPGNKVLAGVDRRFPDLRPLIPLFLRQNLTAVNAA